MTFERTISKDINLNHLMQNIYLLKQRLRRLAWSSKDATTNPMSSLEKTLSGLLHVQIWQLRMRRVLTGRRGELNIK